MGNPSCSSSVRKEEPMSARMRHLDPCPTAWTVSASKLLERVSWKRMPLRRSALAMIPAEEMPSAS